MIIVADLFKVHGEHVPFNASMLYIIANHYADEPVHYYAEKNQCKAVEAYLKANGFRVTNIYWHQIKEFSKVDHGKLFLMKRILSELYSLCRLVRSIKGVSDNKIFFLYLSPIASVFYKLFYPGSVTSLITLHGDVEFIRLQSSRTRNFLGKCFRYSFKKKRENSYYLALEPFIKQNLIHTSLLKEQEIIGISHPYIFKSVLNYKNYVSSLRFGFLGVASVEKNAGYFYDLAKYFKQFIVSKKITFTLIGKNENIPESQTSDLVVNGRNKEMLNRKEFEESIIQLDYALFFHDNKSYQFTSSGSIYDAINFEKPIIAIDTELFRSFFSATGKIGFLCSGIDEMKKVIYMIINNEISEEDYKEMQNNLRKFKAAHSLEKIQQLLFKQLTDLKSNF